MELDEFKSCPKCGEQIRAAAVKCRFCGAWFEQIIEATVAPAVPKRAGLQWMNGIFLVLYAYSFIVNLSAVTTTRQATSPAYMTASVGLLIFLSVLFGLLAAQRPSNETRRQLAKWLNLLVLALAVFTTIHQATSAGAAQGRAATGGQVLLHALLVGTILAVPAIINTRAFWRRAATAQSPQAPAATNVTVEPPPETQSPQAPTQQNVPQDAPAAVPQTATTPTPQPQSRPSPEPRQPIRTNRRPLWISLSVAALLVIGTAGAYLLFQSRIWPFSTGSNNQAFLGTTFSMSIPEVRRTLTQQGAKLLTYDDYKKASTSQLIDIFEILPLYSEDKDKYTQLYMPSIELFEAPTEAKFTFRLGQLHSVDLYFGAYGHTNALAVIESVKSRLLNAYRFAEREPSKDIPAAYRLQFASPAANASLWVNLTDPQHQYIVLTLTDSASIAAEQRHRQDREKKAFGTSR